MNEPSELKIDDWKRYLNFLPDKSWLYRLWQLIKLIITGRCEI